MVFTEGDHTHEEFEYNDHNIHDRTKTEEFLGHLYVLLGLAIFSRFSGPSITLIYIEYCINLVNIELLRKKKYVHLNLDSK